MKLRAALYGVGKFLTSGLVAFLLLFALMHSPLWPRHVQATHDDVKHPAPGEHKHEAKEGEAKDAKSAEKKPHSHDAPSAGEEKNALHHVMDTKEEDPHRHWELFDSFEPHEFPLPTLFGFEITKFMVLEVFAALLIVVIYIPLARRMQNGEVVRGWFFNFFEVLLTFVRDQIAKPSMGEHDADQHVPFLWTLFLFILFNNLLGMLPFGGSATGNIYVTAALALAVFVALHGSGIYKMGFKHYMLSLWPNIDVPFPMGYAIKPLIFVIEWVGVLVRNMVLAVRLFANMFAGHMVTATLLLFIYMARHLPDLLWGAITLSSVLGIVALSLLELFVAFLQAYIFTFLTALFMGMALHPEH